MRVRIVPFGEFKQKCFALIEEVSSNGVELVITKHGHPVCRLMPVADKAGHHRFGWLKGSVKTQGDLTKSIGEKWGAEK